MATTKVPQTRLRILDELLSDRYHHYSIPDLLEKCNEQLEDMGVEPVGRRTIEKDIHYIELDGPYCAEMERQSYPAENPVTGKVYSKRCIRYKDASFSIFKKEMTDDEKYLLGEALNLLGQFDGLPDFEGLEGLRRSLKITEHRRIISLTKNPIEDSTILGQLFSYISNKVCVELKYHTFTAPDESKSHYIVPYLLKEYNRRWFVLGASVEDGYLLTFALDRIDEVIPMSSISYKDCPEDLEEHFEDIVGVTFYAKAPVEHILLWASDSCANYVMSKPIHESQILMKGLQDTAARNDFPKMHGGRFFTIDCKSNYELIRELTSFGAELLVLSSSYKLEKGQEAPVKTVLQLVRERAEAMQNAYKALQ